MIPDKKILRYNNEIGFYELLVSKDVIAYLREKFHLERKESRININHTEELTKGIQIRNSFLLTEANRTRLPQSFRDLPTGTWMIEYTIESEEVLKKIDEEEIKGFSIEGKFLIIDEFGNKKYVYEKFKRMNKLSDLVSFDIYVFGGNTNGAGRNEHGEAHFELKEKNTRNSLGKIYMPNLDKWLISSFDDKLDLLNVINGPSLSKKEKTAFIKWLELNDNENLRNCQNRWNDSNKFNNQAIAI